ALRAVEVEVAALVALLTNLLIAGPALRVVRVLDHPLGGAVGRLLAAASDAARERGRRDTLAATGVAQRTSVAGRVRAAHDRSADTDARHARVAGGARIVVIAAGAVACGGVDAATLRAASIDGTRVAVVTASGAAGGNDLRLALKGERRQAGGL